MNPESATITFPSGLCITVDHFKGLSHVFFLSHFHMDHVDGLRDIHHKCKIYCSSVTKQLVLADQSFKAAHHLLSELPIDSRRPIPELPGIAVTLVPAGHCLGSVMFLFEELNDGGYVALHTGDFRIPTEPEALKSIGAFHRNGRVIPIDYAVVDTTFFTSHCRELPTREESLRVICDLVGDCLDRACRVGRPLDRRHRGRNGSLGEGVVLVSKARFSYEYVYQGLAERFDTKVHISETSLRYYGTMAPDLTFFSTRADDCFVHLKGCGCDTGQMLNICLSTMYFDKTAGFTQAVVWPAERTARVLFSFHPSMREVVDLLAYLRPRSVRALVTPSEGRPEDVQARLEAALPSAGSAAVDCSQLGCQSANKRPRLEFASTPAVAATASGDSDGKNDAGSSDSEDSLCAAPSAGAFAKLARVG